MNDFTELEKAQAAKISELNADNARMRDSLVETQRTFATMLEQEARRDNDKVLRDQFAMTCPITIIEFDSLRGRNLPGLLNAYCKFRYEYADQMMRERTGQLD